MSAENEYGEIIKYERSQTDISIDKLCEGLCSRVYLQRIESGERTCEKLLADALLQRMGVSADKLSYTLNVQEQDIIFLKERLADAVNENRKTEAENYLTEYQQLTEGKSVLHRQFCMLAELVLAWKNGGQKDRMQEGVLTAWNLTREGKPIQKLEGEYLSFYEISLSMLYARLSDDKGEEKKAIAGYLELLRYLKLRVDIQDRVKWYPQVAYRLIVLLRKQGDSKQAIEVSEKTLKLLQSQGSLYRLPELLRQYEELLTEEYSDAQLPENVEKRIADIGLIREALEWLYKEYDITPDEWIWDISFGMSEMYLCQDIIRGRRLGMGMSQEELAEGICDPVTISRIECGKNYPKRKVLRQLLQKLRWPGENKTLTAQVGRPEYHRITSQISMLMHLGKTTEAGKLLEELDKKVKVKNIYARQYFLSNFGVARFGLGEITRKELYLIANEALYLTVPRIDDKKMRDWNFTRSEAMCINIMSYGCETDDEIEHVLSLLEVLRGFYEKQRFPIRYFRAGYELTMRNIGNLLGNVEDYGKAIEASDICIKLALSLKQAGNAAIALYDKGWDMEHLWKIGRYTQEESLVYIKASYALNLFLDRKKQYEFVKRHINDVYAKKA